MWKKATTLFIVVILMVLDTQARNIMIPGSYQIDDRMSNDSTTSMFSSVKLNLVPDHFEVRQNYPNPFNGSTTIEYDLPTDAGVYALVYNILGHPIKTLKNDLQEAGEHELKWDGTTNNGNEAASGIYFYVLLADDNYFTGKMLLLK